MFFDARAIIYIYFFGQKIYMRSTKYFTGSILKILKAIQLKIMLQENFFWWERRQEYR